ncbi:MAG: prolyl oligopeptidase family serine peptidase, partial [Spirochaetaceae bacterium]|nr:prolyl oligopeptidase family serine peptidase [Spirochaetaceae bacterium]
MRLALTEREIGEGEPVRGYIMSDPAYAVSGSASIELVDAAGAVLASIDSPLSREFRLAVPSGLAGPLRVVVRGRGALSSLAAETWVFAGDAFAAASSATVRARARAATLPDSRGFPDEAATLTFLADLVEGRLPSPLSDFDAAVPALVELEILAPAGSETAPTVHPAATLPSPGLGRYAFQSAVDRSLQPFSLYLPALAGPGAPVGLVVVLHGMGADDEDAMRPFAAASPRDLVVLAPYARGDLGYAGPAGRDLADVIDATITRYAIDKTRIYVTGSSMGGFGAWKLARARPGYFAAIAPFAGWTELAGLEPLTDTNALVVHGGSDSVVPAEASSMAAARLVELGAPASLQLLEGVGHDAFSAWIAGRSADRLLEWFRGKSSEPWPTSVSVRASMAMSGINRWVSVTGLSKPHENAGLDARVADLRHIVVETTNVASFELDLAHPSLARGGRILVLADG